MSKKGTLDLSIIIGNYNTKKILHQTLVSIYKHVKDCNFEIIVVDDASSDGSPSYIKELFPQVTLLVNKKNLGYSKSYNRGTKIAKGKYVLHLNSDILLNKRSNLKDAVEYMDRHSDVGILGCRLLKKNNKLDLPCKRSFPTPINVLWETIGLAKLFPNNRIFGDYYLTYLDENKTHEIDCLMGAFMMIRKEVVKKVGLLDEQFFIYGEDIDYCFRTKKSGWKIVYFPKVTIQHCHGATTSNARIKHIRLFHHAMWLYYKKHYIRKGWNPFNLIVTFGIFVRYSSHLLIAFTQQAAYNKIFAKSRKII